MTSCHRNKYLANESYTTFEEAPMSPKHSWLLLLLGVLIASLQVASCEDLIWYQGTSDYYTSHNYGWQGTTDGKSAPQLLLASVINRPWLVTISKSNNIIYWTDNQGVIGAWDIKNNSSHFVYRFDISNWDESSKGPALSGLDVDELNNHLYFSFNRSIYRLDLNQANPSSLLIASYDNLVFNPRFSSSRNSLFFCLRNNFKEQGDLVQVSLSAPTTVTTLVHNTSTGSIVQQLFIDDTTNTLYYNSPGTLTMRGVSMVAPYNEVFKSTYLNTNPSFFDFNPATNNFIFGNLRFDNIYTWSLGPDQPTSIYTSSYSKLTGVKMFNDTHALVAYQYTGSYPTPNEGSLILVDMNNPSSQSVVVRNYGMGLSLFFDEKYCDFYYFSNPQNRSRYPSQVIMRKNIKADMPEVYQSYPSYSLNVMSGIAFDTDKRNLIVSRMEDGISTISYAPLDRPGSTPVPIVDSKGRSISSFALNDKTGDIYYVAYEDTYNLYRLDAKSISKDWINNVGYRIVSDLGRTYPALAVDSVNNKLYFSRNSPNYWPLQIVQSNLDGSNLTVIYQITAYDVRSMAWDSSSNRLYFLATPQSGWVIVSMDSNGLNVRNISLNMSTGSGRALFSALSPDPYSDWLYLNAEYYTPIRIKKDGSAIETLYSYIPISNLRSLAFDESTGNIFFGDVQNSIKKININNINKNDPGATSFELVWQGDYNTFDLQSFILDTTNQVFWTLQTNNTLGYPNYVYTLMAVPINGGPAKRLFDFPKGVRPPFAINTRIGKLYAFSYTITFNPQTPTTLVMMDLYNGSNLVTLKNFKYPDYSSVTPSAVTVDPSTGLIYYALISNRVGLFESLDPVTLTTKRLWQSPDNSNIQVIGINGTSIVMTGYNMNISIYDISTGTVRVLGSASSYIALDSKSKTIYLGGGYIQSMDITDANSTRTMLLQSFTFNGIAFDFAKKTAYFTLKNNSGRPLYTVPYMYQSDLDGRNKKRIQLQNSWYVPSELVSIKLFDGQLYTQPNGYILDVFNVDGSGYERVMQGTSVRGIIKYNEAMQTVHWLEGLTFYSCAVYSNKYADCQGVLMFPSLQWVTPLFKSFVVADNGMVYLAYSGTVYSMDLKKGYSSVKILVNDSRLGNAQSIAMNKKQSELYVFAQQNTIVRVTLDGVITPLYSSIAYAGHLLVTDLSHCK